MPHVEIKCYPGRTPEQKALCAQKVAEAIVSTMGCKPTGVSVHIVEVEKEQWKAEVWDKQIDPNWEELLVKPGYTP